MNKIKVKVKKSNSVAIGTIGTICNKAAENFIPNSWSYTNDYDWNFRKKLLQEKVGLSSEERAIQWAKIVLGSVAGLVIVWELHQIVQLLTQLVSK